MRGVKQGITCIEWQSFGQLKGEWKKTKQNGACFQNYAIL